MDTRDASTGNVLPLPTPAMGLPDDPSSIPTANTKGTVKGYIADAMAGGGSAGGGAAAGGDAAVAEAGDAGAGMAALA